MYSFINIAGISIGLAAFWLIALYVFDELSYDRSFSNANNTYRIAEHISWDGGAMHFPINPPPLAATIKSKFPEVEQAINIDAEGGGVIKFNNKIIKQNDILFADKGFFSIFDHPFIAGDAVAALAQPNSIVITESLAKKIFSDAGAAFNQTIYFGTEPVKITGVIKDVPRNSHLQFSGMRSMHTIPDEENTWKNFYLYTYLVLKPGADITAFNKKLNTFGMQTIAKEMGVKDYRIELQPLTSIHLHSNLEYELSTNSSISRVYIFSAIGILILLIALINYMNLSTARASIRVKEIGIRKVIGSSRSNLAALFITEALLVTFIAALIAGVLVQLSMPLFNLVSGKQLDVWRFGMFNTIAFIMALSFIAGFTSGSYPALLLSRFKLIPSLKGHFGNMQASTLLRQSLVVFQFVIAVFLISGSFIIYKQMQYVNNKDLGFNKEQVLYFHIDDGKVRNEIPAVKAALLQSPLIEDAAAASNPIGGNDIGGHDFAFEKNGVMQESNQMAKQIFVDEDFLKTMNIQLLQGRSFSKDMQTDQSGAIIINETLMKEIGYKNAVGKKSEYRVNQAAAISHRTIIGVVKDFHISSLQTKIEPLVMMLPPVENEKDNLYVKIKKGKTAEGLAYIKKTFATFDVQNTADFNFLDEAFARQYAAEQKQEQLSFVFTVLAFIIACLGLTGLVMFTVAQRVKEIGIRKVLGASVGSVTIMLGKNFMQLVVIATVIAIPVAWFAMNKWLQEFAYRIDIAWWMFLVPGLVAIVIALVTVCVQAVKAALTNPVESLRTE